MRRLIIFLFIVSINISCITAVGYKVNFGLDTGITECLGGSNVQKNVNFWDEQNDISEFLNYGGFITADIVISERFSVESGFSYKMKNQNFYTEDILYGNGLCQINYSRIEMPILAKIVFPIKKTSQILNSIDFGFGINISLNFANQAYSDSEINYNGYFLTPVMNLGVLLQSTYTHKLGPGRIFAGIQADIDFIQQSYSINTRKVNLGNVFTVSPVIGYTFIIKENKKLAKITEKNKRIIDLEVK